MTRVLILSSNVLAEQELQLRLQQMNYEVFVSSSILQHNISQSLAKLIMHFQVVIFSEHLLEEELTTLIPYLSETNTPMIRRVYQQSLLDVKEPYNSISATASPVELKHMIENLLQNQEPIQRIEQVETNKKCNLLQEVSFTPTELLLLRYLYEENGQLVSKQMICHRLWQQKITGSRKVQIYTLLGHIRRKLAKINDHTIFIGAQRASGYYLTQEFFRTFQVEFPEFDLEGE